MSEDRQEGQKEQLIQDLIKTIRVLRSEQGCPWDRKQTHQSMTKYLEEESWEVQDAIEKKQFGAELKEELSDLLLQVVMHAEIAKEKENFDFYDVVACLNEKLIRRHPHVFDKKNIKENFDIEKEWDKIKEKEWGKKYHPLERIPNSASVEYFFQKIITFEKNNNDSQKFDFSILRSKLQSLATNKNNQEKSQLLGEIFCDLAYWAKSSQLSWVSAFKEQLSKKRNILLKEAQKKP